MFNDDFGKEFKSARRSVVKVGIFSVILSMVLNLVFWLAIIGGGVWLLKYFGVF